MDGRVCLSSLPLAADASVEVEPVGELEVETEERSVSERLFDLRRGTALAARGDAEGRFAAGWRIPRPRQASSGDNADADGARETAGRAGRSPSPSRHCDPTGSARLAPLSLGELWAYRELLFFLIWRDIKVRYKQTPSGGRLGRHPAAAAMVVFSVFFGRLAGMPSDGVPYPIFVYGALVPWTLFATALTELGNSLVEQPRPDHQGVLPASRSSRRCRRAAGRLRCRAGTARRDDGRLWYRARPRPLLLLPLFVLSLAAAPSACGLWLAALNVRYRDVRYTLPFSSRSGCSPRRSSTRARSCPSRGARCTA